VTRWGSRPESEKVVTWASTATTVGAEAATRPHAIATSLHRRRRGRARPWSGRRSRRTGVAESSRSGVEPSPGGR
jgi:hypothetical protein